MNTVILRPAADVDGIAGDLAAGRWLVFPYETYGQLDRGEWNDQLVKQLARRGVAADVTDIPRKSVVVVVNKAALPTFDQVTDSIAAIDHLRARRRR